MLRIWQVWRSSRQVRSLNDELAQTRRELEELRARLPPSGERDLLQHIFADRIVLEHLPEVVALLDRHGSVEYLSRTLPGRKVSDMLGKYAVDFLVAEHRERFTDAFERAWSRCEPQTVEYASKASGFWRTRLVPIRQAGRVTHMLASSLDIDEHVRAQEALRETHGRLQHAVDVVGMGTWTRNWQTGVIVFDAAMCAVFGVTPATAPRKFEDLLACVHPDDHELLHASAARARTEGVYDDMEYRIVRPSGEIRHVFARASVQRDAQGRAYGTLGAIFDITERKRLEEQLSQRRKTEAIGEFTAGIAHNFNNVLSIILTNLELCAEHAPPILAARLQDIEEAARRASELVRQLMLFARRDAHAMKSTIDPGTILRRMTTICRTTFDRRIQIDLEIGANVPHVRADPAQLEQVLLNICLNSRDALTDAGTQEPRILLAADRTAEGAARLCVKDNGPGMNEQTRARVFEPFFTTKPIGRGTGLGLASAYAIIGDHCGRIACESRPGDGALFEIVLPAVATTEVRITP